MASKEHQTLEVLRQAEPRSSAYMKTRVLAQVREKQAKKRGLPFWAWFSMGVTFAFALVFVGLNFGENLYSGSKALGLNKPYMIRVDLAPVQDLNIAYAEVQLGQKFVRFSSKEFARISELRELKIQWQSLAGKSYLPLVVEGTESGVASVFVNFYDTSNRLVQQKTISLDFGSI